MFFSAFAQLLGLVCVSGVMVFVVLFASAWLRIWLERLAASAAEALGGD